MFNKCQCYLFNCFNILLLAKCLLLLFFLLLFYLEFHSLINYSGLVSQTGLRLTQDYALVKIGHLDFINLS